VPGPVPGGERLPPGQPLAGELAADPGTAFWILLSDPGAFIMERKMLKGIRSRAEATVQDREQRVLQSDRS
jgi:hypothetical protein